MKIKNKKIENMNKCFDRFSFLLDEKKEEINFDKLSIDYQKNKKYLKEINEEFEKNETKKDLLEKIKDADSLKEKHLIEFKKIDELEKKLFVLSKKSSRIISSLDKRKNFFEYKILTLKIKNEIILKNISSEYNDSLGKNIQKNKDEIYKTNEKINNLKEVKKPFNYLKYKKNNLEKENIKIINELKLNKSKNIKKENISIDKNNMKIKKFEEESNIINNDINGWLKLLKKIELKLTFKDDGEYEENQSFFINKLNVWYDSKQVLFNINMKIPKKQVIAIIGPSGCGKSTFLRTLNRINDNVSGFHASGDIIFNGEYDVLKLKSIKNRYKKLDISTLRTKIGMIFQLPNPFPMSIYKNISYGPSVKGIKNKAFLNVLVDNSLKDAGLYEEVKDDLKSLGTSLSGGQQQRLCIARAIANEPEVLLMDEPTSSLDPISSKKIEDLILELKKDYTIIMVTHSMQQAERISDKIAFFYQGKLIEFGDTKKIFNNPKRKETKKYIQGKFG